MNERIKQLAEQAGILKEQTVKAKIVKNEDGTWTSILEYPDLEKFAELLIKECGQWFNNRLTVEPDYGFEHRIERNLAVVGVMKEYNTHFGVEE